MKYVIQRHESKKLHFDLRLEHKGVLKSWAVPKEPSKKIGEKRLAVQVPDHALGYEKFHGIIKEGYGKGKVEIWDSGSYDPIKIKEGKEYIVKINGKKLKGVYCLIKFKEKNWLFFKKKI